MAISLCLKAPMNFGETGASLGKSSQINCFHVEEPRSWGVERNSTCICSLFIKYIFKLLNSIFYFF